MSENTDYQNIARKLLDALRAVTDFRDHEWAYEWINDKKTTAAFTAARKLIAKVEGELK